MRQIIQFFVKHEILANLILLLLAGTGMVALFNLQSTLFPKQDPEYVVVEAVYPGASPSEMEEGIVLKVEENLEGIQGVERVRSTSRENRATIRVELFPDVNAYEVHQEIKNAIDRVASFPEGMERIVAYIEEPVNPAGTFAITGDVSMHVLKDMADRVEADLRSKDNISRIEVFGYTPPEIEINVSETDLRRYGLTFTEITRAVAAENIQVTGGQVRGPEKNYRIRLDEKEYYARGFNDVVVRANPDGQQVLLRDVATINDTFSEDTEQAYLDGKRAVYFSVNTTNEENIQQAAEHIKAYITDFNERNAQVQATLVDDATSRLDDRIDVLKENGLLGFLLVMLILGLFLRVRLAFWVALGIPISFCGMFLLALYYGVTINFFSLFGMIVVLGILVDDGIVVGENVYQKYREGLPPIQAAVEGTMEVAHAVLSAVITTILALSFFYFIPARVGDMFSDVAFIVSATLLVSLVEVMILLPSHLAHSKALHKKGGKTGWQEKIADWVLDLRDRLYVPLLRWSLSNKLFVFLIMLALIVFTFASVGGGIVRTNYFPQLERNEVEVTMQLQEGINEETTRLRTEQVVRAAQRLNEQYRQRFDMREDLFKHSVVRIGPESNEASLVFYLMPSEEREIRSFAIASDLRRETGRIPDLSQISYTKEKQIGKPVELSLVSPDVAQLSKAAVFLKQRLANIPQLRDIIDNQNANEPELRIRLKDKARLLGFTNREIVEQVRNGFFGSEVQRLQRGKNEVKVWVRYGPDDRRSIEELADMRIRDEQGNAYPLGELARIERTMGLVSINHRDGLREIKVEAEMASQKASAPVVLERIRSEIIPELQQQFPSVDYLFEGQVLQSREVFQAGSTVLPVLLILIFSVIVFAFRSFIQSAMLFVLMPFGIIGAVWGHYVHDIAIGILSLLGFIALIGILVNDGLVFVTMFNNKLKQGLSFHRALVETGRARFRPILLTSITTIAGLAPLIFEKSFQAQFLIPMAVSVAYGLLFTTFLLLIGLPIMLVAVNKIKRTWHWIWEGEWVAPEEVEPALQEKHWEEENVE